MADDEDLEAHEQVVTSLHDLQAKLRGEVVDETPAPADATPGETIIEIPEAEGPKESLAGWPATPEVDASPEETPEASDVQVLVTPDPDGAAEREDFAPVTTLPVAGAPEPRLVALSDRLARIEQEMSQVTDRVGSVADPRDDRILALEQRLRHEVGSQRADLLRAIHDRFDRLEATIAEALGDVRVHPDEPDGDEPA
ncbi:MAG TPA: hypothetical protein VGR41_10455 [Actinomycetota bacterium]|jgi:hypothetical protein|nr:hypothetical protein [Actinomycetota bacterium]